MTLHSLKENPTHPPSMRDLRYPTYSTPKHHSRLQAWTIGRLSNNDGHGTIKVNSRCFKINHATSISLNWPNVGIFFWSWIRILKDCKKVSKKEKKVVVLCSRPQQNVKLRNLTSKSCSDGKCSKKRDAHEKLLFCWSKPIALLTFSLPSLSLLLPISRPQMWTIMVLQVKLYHAPGQQTVQVWPALFLKHCLKHFLMLTKEHLQVVKHFVANPPARLTSVLKVSMSTLSFIVLNVNYYCRHCEWWKYNNHKP